MNIKTVYKNNTNIAVISSDNIIIHDAQDVLDLMANIRYDYKCDKIILSKENITEDFFDLKNGIAGEIMQKIINYEFSLAIVGDFDNISSKSLKSLIYELNKGKTIIFKNSETEAIESLSE